MIVAGIDEAGYGPTLGPYVAGLAAFRVPGDLDEFDVGRSVDLYESLRDAVTRGGGERDLVAVADSKVIYSPAQGIRRLEETVMTFLEIAGQRLPDHLDAAIALLAPADLDALHHAPWHRDTEGEGGRLLPRAASLDRVEGLAARLYRSMQAAGLELVELTARVTDAREWNQSIDRTQNKATTAFGRVSQHVQRLWQQHAEEGVLLYVDKQGGRNAYAGSLSGIFPALSLETLCEGAELSCYRARAGVRRLQVSFAPRADDSELPVALASIVAKYLRELLMERMNTWFAARQPDLRSTAGYPVDARRWLAETEELRRVLEIHDEDLVRTR